MTPERKEEIREWANGIMLFQVFPEPKDKAIAELLTALDELEEEIKQMQYDFLPYTDQP